MSSTPPHNASLRFTNRRSPCPTCGARHGFASLVDHDEGGKCHACGVFVPPEQTVLGSEFRVLRKHAPQNSEPRTQNHSPAADRRQPASASPWELFRTHDYYDEEGAILFHIDRYHRTVTDADGGTEMEKTFRQRPAGVLQRQRDDAEATPIGASMKGVRLVLYELPSLICAMRQGARIWIVEGEKAADWLNLWFREELGWPDRATTAPGGSNGWREEFADFLIGATVCVWADADEAGKHHAQSVLDSMNGAVPGVQIVHLDQIPEIPNE